MKYSCRGILQSVPLLLILLSSNRVTAQIVPDTSLPINSIATPNGNAIAIEGGTEMGNNLFHSFEVFSLPTGSDAFFNNSLTINNIITRVTGGQISNIDGLLSTNGTANLFLINPNGIHFGENARLEVGGSFLASTADRILFEDGSVFDATNPGGAGTGAVPLLTVSVPVGIQFGDRDNSAGITNVGNLSASGDLTLSGSQVTSTGELSSDRGNLTIEAVTGDLQVENSTARGISLSTSGNAIVGGLDTQGVSGGGDIAIDAGGNILINGNLNASGSFLSILPTLSFNGDGGNISLTAGGDITFVPGTSLVVSLGTRGGDIRLSSGGAIVIEDALIGNVTTGNGRGGDITLTGDSILLRNFGRVATLTPNEGRGGDISVTAAGTIDILSQRESPNFGQNNPLAALLKEFLSDDAFNTTGIATTTFSNGRGGDITLRANRLNIRNETPLTSNPDISTETGVTTITEPNSFGNGGDISIEVAESVELVGNRPGAFVPSLDENVALTVIRITTGLASATNGRGDSGNLTINTERLTVRDGAAATSGNSVAGIGSSGNVTVNATQIEFQGLAGLVSGTTGTGDAGDLVVNADSIVLRDGSAISADTIGSADAGILSVNTRTLTLDNGSRIGAATSAQGQGSTVSIFASESIDLVGTSVDGTIPSGLFADSQGSGEAGNLAVTTGQLRVRDGADITVSSSGEAPRAGNLEITADTLQLENGGKIEASTNVGDGGNLNLQVADLLLLRQESNISTTAGTDEAGGNGGNIDIDTDFIVALPTEDSNITANAFEGNGGNVNIAAQSVFGIEFRETETTLSDITASSEFGQQGVVTFEVPDLDPASGLVNLPESTVDVAGLVGNPCDRGLGKFVTTGRSGLPISPYDPIDSLEILEDIQPPMEWGEEEMAAEPLVEATGWRTNDRGEVELVTEISQTNTQTCR